MRNNLRFADFRFMIGRRAMMFGRILTIFNILIFAALFAACSSDDETSTKKATTHTYKVAVMAHTSALPRWERTAKWALQNMAEAQRGMTERVELELTFKNQEDEDIAEYMKQIAEDPEVVAIIGPTTSVMATQMALQLDESKVCKPMITPAATYVQYQRRFANVPYVWNMSESDITEMEVIISDIATVHKAERTSLELLAPDDGTNDVRNDYVEWFSFIAEEYGLEVSKIYFYRNSNDLYEKVRAISGPTRTSLRGNILVFTPATEEDAIVFDAELGRYRKEIEATGKRFFAPHRIYCTDNFVTDRIAATVKNFDYEGVDLYASPGSGFIQAYHKLYGDNLVNGEAQFFDALYMVAYAATLSQHTGQDLNDALMSVVDGDDGTGGSWLPSDMTHNFQMLAQGICPDIDGVSSDWTFDKKTHASVIGSTYRRWRVSDGQFATLEYVSTEGSRRSFSTKTIWDWTATRFQTFNAEVGSELTYPILDDHWALLIAASKGWANYRFQADVFTMYQILRQRGYDNEHIVLICEDDIARHPNNPHQNALYVSEPGPNVYEGVVIDYKLSTLTPADIGDILQGKASERLSKVIKADNDDNVLVFWSSHGSPGSMDFGDDQMMTYNKMKEILSNTPHRKLLFAIEACYSGGLGQACEGLPGCLFITAANPYETSHADVWSEEVGVYLSNGFTHGFQKAVYDNPDISLRDLYYSLARNTSGSHVKVYNDHNYGSVYHNTMKEYLNLE